MKCIKCETDSKLKDRADGRCPKCKAEFAFEPAGTKKDPVTDMLFKKAIDAVSSGGRIKWGVEHLYYEVARRKRMKFTPGCLILTVFLTIWLTLFGGGVTGMLKKPGPGLFFLAALPTLFAATYFWYLKSKKYPDLDRTKFASLWDRWVQVHGAPPGLITRAQERPAASLRSSASFGRKAPSSVGAPSPASAVKGLAKPVATAGSFGKRAASATPPTPPGTTPRTRLESDIGDYSFDRVVICDRARTVDLLIANNFHFENNCAVLSIDGYPEEPFATVKAMIMRNPRLQVFVVHDATADGCRLAHHLAYSPDWFAGRTRVIDLGLRPRHAEPYRGLWRAAGAGTIAAEPGIDAKEAQWLSQHELEIAALRPEFVLKRLFNGFTAHANDTASGSDSGGVCSCGSFDGGSSDGGSHGATGDSGADSFG